MTGIKNRLGIYKISSKIDERCYIGSSINLYNRFKEHKSLLLRKEHPNTILQNFVNKYEFENLEFQVIENILIKDIDFILEREQYYIDLLKPTFNIRKIAISNKGIKWGHHSEESKRKIAEKVKGNKNCVGKKLSIERIENLRQINLGKKLSEETKFKISIGNKGKSRLFTSEHKLKISLSNKGKNKTLAHCKAISIAKRKVSDDQLIQIKEFYNKNISSRKIAILVNLSRTTVQDIKNNKVKYI